MTLRLHDTATQTVRDFVPLREGQVGIYVCGLTVQSEPHVGHVRSAVNFDVLRLMEEMDISIAGSSTTISIDNSSAAGDTPRPSTAKPDSAGPPSAEHA